MEPFELSARDRHNLGLQHLAGGGNLMNSSITGATTASNGRP